MSRLKMIDTPWAVDILHEGTQILKSMKLKYWLSSGTMLGIHREGKLIDHDDPDIDLGIQEPLDHEMLKEKFLSSDFTLFAEGTHQIVFIKNKILFDMYFYKQVEDELHCFIEGLGTVVKPYKLFEKLGRVKFNGHYYPTPSPVGEYLRVRYGDWETPKKRKVSWTKETPALKKH